MNIYYLAPTEAGSAYIDYDSYDGHVVVARNAHEAREMVPCGDEGGFIRDERRFWKTPALSSCEPIGITLDALAEPGVILSSFRAG